MVTAYLTKTFFAECAYYFAEIIFTKERTTLAFVKNKMGIIGICVVNVFRKLFGKLTLNAFVIFKGILVYIYFPADTAIVTALGGNTLKVRVIVRGNGFHIFTSLFYLVIRNY